MKKSGLTDRFKGLWALLLIFALIGQSAGSAWAAEGGGADSQAGGQTGPSPLTESMRQAMEKAESLLLEQESLPDWAAVGLALNGKTLPESHMRNKADELLENRGRYDKVSDLARAMIEYTAFGGDVKFVAGLDLYPVLMNHPGMEKEGVLGLALAFMAGNYSYSGTLARTEWYPDLLLNRLVNLQRDEGSWAFSAEEAEGSVEATALALAALAPFGDSEPTRRGLEWLKARQTEDGGFGGTTGTALVVIALSAFEIDAAAWTRPEGSQPLQVLESLLSEAGKAGEGGASLAETAEAYLALTVYRLFLDGEQVLGSLWQRPEARDTVTVRIEGPEGTVAEGWGQSGDALSSALAFLEKEGIAYKVKEDGNGERSLDSIAGIGSGRYGGKDGWRLAARSKFGSWLFPENAPEGLRLSAGDRLFVYYGSDNTALLDMPVIEYYSGNQGYTGSPVLAGTSFRIYVKKANRYLGGLPAEGVTVSVGGKTAVSDAEGKVTFAGLKPGVYRIKVAGYRNNAAPSLARDDYPLRVSAPELSTYSDQAQVSEWARYELANILTHGYMEGVKDKVLAPKQPLTRAQYAIMLLRLLNEPADQAAGGTFSDVPAGSWYSGALAKAARLGLTDRTSGRFEPDRAITREEAAVMTARAGRLATYGTAERMAFSDVAGLPEASRHAIQAVFEHEVMTGNAGQFHPKQTLVREQAAAILSRMHTLLYSDGAFT
ncbi:S-layer homology domain-containing protein [Cohnella hongkongensis]|uniref:S-layer homology domain-containing protein n=1 Tax=Cohnella hongkongensis TaxID=178337 RepID=A0ABV9F750_9BACL